MTKAIVEVCAIPFCHYIQNNRLTTEFVDTLEDFEDTSEMRGARGERGWYWRVLQITSCCVSMNAPTWRILYAAPKPIPGKRLMAFRPMLSAAELRKMARFRFDAVCAGEFSAMSFVSL
jgi:hypothetical protein